MAAALCDLIGQADRLVRVSVSNLKGHDPAKLVAEHVALIEAMQQRDGRTATRLIKAHIAQTEKRVLPALKRNAVIVDGRKHEHFLKTRIVDVEIHGNFVDGREVEAGAGEMLDVRNPATGDVIARIPNSTREDIDRAMKSARAAFEGKPWSGMDTRARARLVNRLADAFEANLDALYRLETLNNGRPVNETRAQLSRLPDFFRYFAGSRCRAATP